MSKGFTKLPKMLWKQVISVHKQNAKLFLFSSFQNGLRIGGHLLHMNEQKDIQSGLSNTVVGWKVDSSGL